MRAATSRAAFLSPACPPPQAMSVPRGSPRRWPFRAAIALAIALTRASTGRPNSSATSFRSSDMERRLRRQLHEGQRRRGPQIDRAPEFGVERLAVEDHVRAFALDGDLVRLLEM